MTNKIIRAIIFIAIIMLYFVTHADRWVNRTLPQGFKSIIGLLVIYLPILFILCYRSISSSLLASVAISLLSFVVFIFGMLIWMSCFFLITIQEKNEFKEAVGFFLVLLVTALSSHLWGFVINRWIKKMNPDNTSSEA